MSKSIFTIDNPLEMAQAITKDLAERVITTMRKGDMLTTAQLYNDLTFLQAAVEQLSQQECKTAEVLRKA
jgi:hypothetical protein